MHCWHRLAEKIRIFREIFIVIGRKNGKSLFASAIIAYIRSVSNKGFYVCKYNTDYLHEKQLMELEKRLQEWITLAKQAGLGTEDIREMLEGLL